MIEPNLFLPGVVVLQTAMSGGQLWALVCNNNKNNEIIHRDTPITTAQICDEDTEFVGLNMLDKKYQYIPMSMQNDAARLVIMISSISDATARADDGIQLATGQPDDLDKSLFFNPSEVYSSQVEYNEYRLQRILQIMDVQMWEITESQRLGAVDLIPCPRPTY